MILAYINALAAGDSDTGVAVRTEAKRYNTARLFAPFPNSVSMETSTPYAWPKASQQREDS